MGKKFWFTDCKIRNFERQALNTYMNFPFYNKYFCLELSAF